MAGIEQGGQPDTQEKQPDTAPETEQDTAPAEADGQQPDTASETEQDAAPAETDGQQPDNGTKTGAEEDEAPYTAKQFLCDVLDLVESVIMSVFVVIMTFTFVFCIATVEGDSMLPTLTDGDRLVVTRIGRSFRTGDILIIDSETAALFDAEGELFETKGLGKRIVKRLIASGGQTVDIDFSPDAGIVYVDGKALDETYTAALTTRDNGAFSYPITVPEGYVFVLGDNRHVSKDSRHPGVGLIPENEVIGKVVLRILPLTKFGAVK